MTRSITETLAEWAVAQRERPLASATKHQAKLALIDLLGVTIGGMDIPSAAAIRSLALAQGGASQSTLIGIGTRTSGLQAALANGTAGHALDMDDGHRLAA